MTPITVEATIELTLMSPYDEDVPGLKDYLERKITSQLINIAQSGTTYSVEVDEAYAPTNPLKEVLPLIKDGKKADAVRILREHYNLGLSEAIRLTHNLAGSSVDV